MNSNPKTCDACPAPATVHCVWGVYERREPMNEANLCKACSDDLWSKIKWAVNAGIMHWTCRDLRKDS